MEMRRLGRTERQVSLLGVGGGYLTLLGLDRGTQIYQRAAELGVTYFDGRYGHSGLMQRPVIRQDRERFVVATKTAAQTREEALRRIDEDLAELDTAYLDIFYLRTYNRAMLAAHFAPGGSLEGVQEACRQGKVRAVGLAGHSDLSVLVSGVETDRVDVVMFPLNVVRRDALAVLIPVCRKHDAGTVVMKPLNAGLVPAEVSLPWLANQPIHTMAPGISTLAQLEADVLALDREPLALSAEEEAAVASWRAAMDRATCRICDGLCQAVCEQGLRIDWMLYHNVLQNEFRRLGLEGFMRYPFAPWVKKRAEAMFRAALAQLAACTHCGRCEQVCPHHLPVMSLLEEIQEGQSALVEALAAAGWAAQNASADSPMPALAAPTGRRGSGGR
jgi:predicted aldo/keto reductase-like oxidoreductase